MNTVFRKREDTFRSLDSECYDTKNDSKSRSLENCLLESFFYANIFTTKEKAIYLQSIEKVKLMNTLCTYLGLPLKNPVIVSSSPLTGTSESIVKCAKAGAGAIVLKSIFEEQIHADIKKEESYSDIYDSHPEMSQYLSTFVRGNEIEIYTKLIREAKAAVDIPVIASINCTNDGEWISFAKNFQNAGADAIELNIAIAPFDYNTTPRNIEDEYIEILKQVEKSVRIPISVKIGSHFTNICNMAFRLANNGAKGVVLFNRFYNPDFDIESLKVVAGNSISANEENSTTLRYVALLKGQNIPCDISAATGIYNGKDVIKQILAGASTVQLCSSLYKNGLDNISDILVTLTQWMQSHNFNTITDFKGLMGKPGNSSMERMQYLRRNSEQ